MLDKNKIAVISTGNGGQSMAAYFAYHGYSVALYAREQERVDMYHTNTFMLDGPESGEVVVDLISCDMKKVVKNAHLIMVTTPSQYHWVVAKEMAKHLQDGQVVVLNPGRTLGTHNFLKVLEKNGLSAKIHLAETDTFAFTCRCAVVGWPHIYRIKKDVLVAAHDPLDTPFVLETLNRVVNVFVPAESVMHTGFLNIGMIFHPLPILMNITRVEAKEEFLYYHEGISPLVSTIMERLDAERVAVAKMYGIDTLSADDWLTARYGSQGNTLYEKIQNTNAYAHVYAPTDIDTRYVMEDVTTGCVPVLSMARRAGMKTPTLETVVQMASMVYEKDFYADGRKIDDLD